MCTREKFILLALEVKEKNGVRPKSMKLENISKVILDYAKLQNLQSRSATILQKVHTTKVNLELKHFICAAAKIL